MEGLLDWKIAREIILEQAKLVAPTELISIENSFGRILGKDVFSPIDLPPFDRSLVDGYAVGFPRGSEEDVWKIIGESGIGSVSDSPLGDGEAHYLPTGGIIPEKTFAVIKAEDVTADRGGVSLNSKISLEKGTNIELSGSDVAKGARLIDSGVKIGIQHISLLSAVGIARVTVREKPRVVLIVTGTEVKSPGEELTKGEIFDST